VDAGGVFRKVSEAVDAGRSADSTPIPRMTYSLGVDLARVQDFTVLTVVDATGRQVYFDRFNQISWERQIASILDVARRYRAHVWMDSTGVGDPPFEAVRSGWGAASGFHFTNSTKGALIDNLAMRIEGGKVRLMDLPVQTAELLSYQYELTPSRNVRMNAPAGQNDDCVIALALAFWGLAQPPPSRLAPAGSLLGGYRG
jgi:phage FluMu gp28-like protein